MDSYFIQRISLTGFTGSFGFFFQAFLKKARNPIAFGEYKFYFSSDNSYKICKAGIRKLKQVDY